MTYLDQELDKQMEGFHEALLEGERQRLKKAYNDWENAEFLLNSLDDDDLARFRDKLMDAQRESERIMDESEYFLGEHGDLKKKE
jgi:hypothetical protein